MKVVLFTGSHPRHYYLANKMNSVGYLQGHLVEERRNFMPEPPRDLTAQDRDNFIRHFQDRNEAEKKAFGVFSKPPVYKDIPYLKVKKEDLNTQQVIEWVQMLNPDLVITYGVHKIEKKIMSVFPSSAWNIHGGLSPWYRGNITLFWPFYFLQPNCAGMTVHHLSSVMDAGDIIHHSVPTLEKGDGIHDVACKAVIQVSEDLPLIASKLGKGEKLPAEKQKTKGKLFTSSDWKPHHLRLIYNTFNNDIVDHYLDGELLKEEPPLVKAI